MNEEGTRTIEAGDEEERRFQGEFEHLPLGFAHLDRDGRLLRANPQLGRFAGRPPAELAALRLDEITHPDEREACSALASAIAAGEQAAGALQQRLLRPDGPPLWVRLSLAVRHDGAGGIAGLLAIFEDLGEHRRLQQALQEGEQRLELVLEAALMDAFEYDVVSGQVRRHGSLGLRLGLPQHAPVGALFERIHPDDREGLKAALASLSPERPGYEAEFRFRSWDGRWRRMADRAIGHFDAQGRLVRLVGACADVTERRHADESLARERETLRQIIDSIPVMLCFFDLRSGRYQLNRHCEQVLGWHGADANAGDFLARLYPDAALRATVQAFMNAPGTEWREWSTTARDGTQLPCDWTKIRLSDGTLVSIGLDRRQRRANEARLALHAGRQALLLELTRSLLQARHDEAGTVRSVFDQVARHFDADVCLGFRVSGGEDRALSLVAACGVAPGAAQALRQFGVGQSYCDMAARAALPVMVDAQQIERQPQGALARSLGLRAVICHPLQSRDGQVLGVFSLASTRRERFLQEEADFLQALCHFIALAWERLHSERQLRRREQQYRLALAAGRLGAWRFDPATKLLDVDARARAQFGFDEAQVPLAALIERVHPLDRPRVAAKAALLEAAVPDEEVSGIEYRVIHPDGSERWISVESRIHCEGEGEELRCISVGTSADVTERKRIEHALRETAADLQRAQAVAHVGSWYVDFRRNLGRWSDETCRIFGMPPGAPMTYADFLARVHPQDLERVDACWRLALGGAPYDLEHRVVVDGAVKWVRQRAELEFEAGGRPLEAFGTVQDITERKLADEALRQVAAERAEAARRKDEFLATLAHELRNPLNPIRNAAQLLRLGGGEEARLRWSTDVIERQVTHLTRLIDDLLDVSRITHNKLGLRPQRITLREVIEGALESILPLIEKRRHVLDVELPDAEVALDGDPVRLVQVFQNLLDNAAKYTPPGGRIAVSARCGPGLVEVCVHDSGIGLAPDALAHVFDMFYQAEHGGGGGGLGIGLTLVQRLVQMHGGSIEARSAGIGLGCVFVVRLPLPPAEPAAREVAPPTDAEAPLLHRILVVDDNVDSAESTALLLRLEGHEVHLAHDGLQAVQEAQRLRPTLVLLDIGMPLLDGYEAARRIRASDWGRGMLLVAQTGWGQQDDVRRALEAGFDAHFTKPVDMDALMALVGRKPAVPA